MPATDKGPMPQPKPANEHDKTVVNRYETMYVGTPEDTVKMYTEWSDNYEQDMTTMSTEYGPNHILAKIVDEYATEKKLIDPKNARTLDIACGTGWMGKTLQPFGYANNLDGLDGSEGMLKQAKELGIYKELHCELVFQDRLKSIADETYDLVVSSASLVPGHLKAWALYPLGLTLKKGGYLFAIMCERNLWKDWFADMDEVLVKLETEKKCLKLIEKRIVPGYYAGLNGAIFVFQRI